MHTHVVPESFPAPPGGSPGTAWPRMDRLDDGRAEMVIDGAVFRAFRDVCWDARSRAAELPSLGVDKQVLSPLPELLMYHLDAGRGAALAHHLNEAIAAMVAEEPERFYGLGSAPLQDVELAVAELDAIKRLGLHGVEIRTNVEGADLGEQRFRPFFRRAEALGLAVFVHAYRPTIADRLARLPAALGEATTGFPIESGLAGASMIWSGLLEECPDLRMCLSHGGGVLVQLLARGQDAYAKRKPVQDLLPNAPMDYARRLYYDDLAFSIPSLRFVIDSVGASQVMVGSDYQGQGRRDPQAEDEFDALGLSGDERELLGHRNARRFLGAA